MTEEQHAKTLIIAHLVYATGIALILGSVGWMLSRSETQIAGSSLVLLMVLCVSSMAPFLFTAYGVLFDRPWARSIGLVSVVLSILSFPFGTAVAIYTLWYFLSDKGRRASH